MNGEDARGYADAFRSAVETLFSIVKSEYGVFVLLALLVIGLGALVIWMARKERQRTAADFVKLEERLGNCESRHDACEKRERRNTIAIATLHGTLSRVIGSLPEGHPQRRATDSAPIPTLQELLSGDEQVAAAYGAALPPGS